MDTRRTNFAWLSAILFVTPIVVSENLAAAETPAPAFVRVSGVADEVAIVPMSDSSIDLLRILCGQAKSPAFTPTMEEVRRAEAGLTAYLQKAAPARAAVLWQKVHQYRRQYGGVLVGKGAAARRKLILNASCREDGRDFLQTVIAVKDGGTCYYQLTFDLLSGAFGDLRINGEG